jgi:hypothetical protein
MQFLDKLTLVASVSAAGVAGHAATAVSPADKRRLGFQQPDPAMLHAPLSDMRVSGVALPQRAASENGQGTFEITGTDWLKARPCISGKAAF